MMFAARGRSHVCSLVLVGAIGLAGCGESSPPSVPAGATSPGDGGYGGYGGYGSGEISFLDEVESQSSPEIGLYDLQFTSADGKQTAVRDYGQGRFVVLVVTRGNTVPICPYCSTQTAHYIRDYDKFRARNAEVVVVYPVESAGDQQYLMAFLDDARQRLDDPSREVPFPVVFDVELTAVDRLGIRKDLSKPTTYVIAPDGEVQFAYVGAHLGDRPSTSKILARLDELQPSSGNSPGSPTD